MVTEIISCTYVPYLSCHCFTEMIREKHIDRRTIEKKRRMDLDTECTKEASVVQWISHSLCKPMVASSIPGFSKKQQQKNCYSVEPSGAPLTTTPTQNNLMVLVSSRNKPEDQWSCKRSPESAAYINKHV